MKRFLFTLTFALLLGASLLLLNHTKQSSDKLATSSEKQILNKDREFRFQENEEAIGEQRPDRTLTPKQREDAKKAILERKQLRKGLQADDYKLQANGVLVNITEMGPNLAGESFQYDKPYGGMIKEMIRDYSDTDGNNNNDRIVVATETGGAWLSENSGAIWNPIDDDWAFEKLTTVAQDPFNSNSYFFGGEGSGLFHWNASNTNNGLEVVNTSYYSNNAWHDHFQSVYSIRFHPNEQNRFFIAGVDAWGNNGLFETTDNGSTFSNIFEDGNSKLNDLVVTTNRVLVGTRNGIFSMTKSGGTWSSETEVPAPANCLSAEIEMNEDDPNFIYGYFIVNTTYSSGKKDIYFCRSTNGGNSFENNLVQLFPEWALRVSRTIRPCMLVIGTAIGIL